MLDRRSTPPNTRKAPRVQVPRDFRAACNDRPVDRRRPAHAFAVVAPRTWKDGALNVLYTLVSAVFAAIISAHLVAHCAGLR